MWGANAVNGVINILTKKASATPGTLIDGLGDSTWLSIGTLQHGGKLRGLGVYRAYVSYRNEDRLRNPEGLLSNDGWHLLHSGFRSDARLSSRDSLSLQGDLYTGSAGVPVVAPFGSAPLAPGQLRNKLISAAAFSRPHGFIASPPVRIPR